LDAVQRLTGTVAGRATGTTTGTADHDARAALASGGQVPEVPSKSSEPSGSRTRDPLLKRLSGSVHHTIPHHRNPGTSGVPDVASCSPLVTDGALTRYNARTTGAATPPAEEVASGEGVRRRPLRKKQMIASGAASALRLSAVVRGVVRVTCRLGAQHRLPWLPPVGRCLAPSARPLRGVDRRGVNPSEPSPRLLKGLG